jgi:peptidoglycan LD-endopeptidase CwlK
VLQNHPKALFKYSQRSLQRLSTCHPDLIRLFLELSRTHDVSIIVGFRDNKDQLIAYQTGKSEKKPGCSKHNHYPSMAVDAVPANAPRLWKNGEDLPRKTYEGFAKDIFDLAGILKIKLRWGGDWNGNGISSTDQTLNDFAHWELV